MKKKKKKFEGTVEAKGHDKNYFPTDSRRKNFCKVILFIHVSLRMDHDALEIMKKLWNCSKE